jgi:hypothetical protein
LISFATSNSFWKNGGIIVFNSAASLAAAPLCNGPQAVAHVAGPEFPCLTQGCSPKGCFVVTTMKIQCATPPPRADRSEKPNQINAPLALQCGLSGAGTTQNNASH